MRPLLALTACVALSSCGSQTAATDWACDTPVDTTWVDRPHERGVWLVADSLYLYGVFRPFDPATCAAVGATSGLREGTCALDEVGVPFAVYQTGADDTLHVIKGTRSYPFELDEAYCSDSEW